MLRFFFVSIGTFSIYIPHIYEELGWGAQHPKVLRNLSTRRTPVSPRGY